MELGCEEERKPMLTVQEYVKKDDFKGAIKWLNEFIKNILEENKDNFLRISFEDFPRPKKIPFDNCSEKRKKGIGSTARKELEKTLTLCALKQEGGVDSILQKLDERIETSFLSTILDLAEMHGNYHHWLNNFFNAEKMGIHIRECFEKILHPISRIDELGEFSFDVSAFVREIVSKYEKMSPTVELSTQLLGIEEVKLTPELLEVPQKNTKTYEITIENISLVPILNPRLEFDIELKEYTDGQFRENTGKMTVNEKNTKTEPEHYRDKFRPSKPLNCLVPGYLYTYVFVCHKWGSVALRLKGKLFYEGPFLKGEKKISLGEELRSDNYLEED